MANSKARGVAYDDPSFDSLNVTGATTLDGNVDIGNAAADLIGFHGATAVDQAAFVSTQSINALSVSGVVGFTSSTSLSSLIGKVNSIIDLLIEKGLMAAS